MSEAPRYDAIGRSYVGTRAEDPRIEEMPLRFAKRQMQPAVVHELSRHFAQAPLPL